MKIVSLYLKKHTYSTSNSMSINVYFLRQKLKKCLFIIKPYNTNPRVHLLLQSSYALIKYIKNSLLQLFT